MPPYVLRQKSRAEKRLGMGMPHVAYGDITNIWAAN